MADYRAAARRAAVRAGIDPNVFVRQINQESGFNPNARSGAGAIGIAQIMPGTARGWGIDPTDPIASLNAAAKNMASYVKQYGGYENALRAYNAGPGAIKASHGYAETNAYVNRILNGTTPKAITKAAAFTSSASSPIQAAAQMEASFDPVTLPERPKLQVTNPQAPAHTASLTGGRQAKPSSALDLLKSSGPAKERLTAQSALKAITALEGSLKPAQTVSNQISDADPQGDQAGERMKTGGSGAFKITGPDPDRLQPHLVAFARKVADTLGTTLTGADGSTHSKYTTTGNVSQHYSGQATDIFNIGGKTYGQKGWQEALIAAGRAALIAAGMDPAKARKAGIGLYNVGGHQIIFGTNSKALGGDHRDHLHISAV